MPLFGGKKEPQVTIAYENGPKVALVMTPTWPQPLQNVVDANWVSIAALAWEGYSRFAPGLVTLDPETEEMSYVPADDLVQAAQTRPGFREVFESAQNYYPDTQVVLLTRIVFARGFRRSPEDLLATLTMPKGGISPVAAYELETRVRSSDRHSRQ